MGRLHILVLNPIVVIVITIAVVIIGSTIVAIITIIIIAKEGDACICMYIYICSIRFATSHQPIRGIHDRSSVGWLDRLIAR